MPPRVRRGGSARGVNIHNTNRTKPRRWRQLVGTNAIKLEDNSNVPATSSTAASNAPSALTTDFWHIESGTIDWRSDWLRSHNILARLETHLLQGDLSKKKKIKRKKKSTTATAAASSATEESKEDASAAQTGSAKKKKQTKLKKGAQVIDLTDTEPPAAIAVDSSSSSSDSEPEIDVDTFLHTAESVAYGTPIVTKNKKGSRSKRGKKRIIREDEEENGGDENDVDLDNGAETIAQKRSAFLQSFAASHVGTSAGAAAAAASSSSQLDADVPPDSDEDMQDEPDSLLTIAPNLKSILSTFHTSRRKLHAKDRARRKREEKASNGSIAKRGRKRPRSQGRVHDADSLPSSPDRAYEPEKRTKKQVKSNRTVAWKEEHSKAAMAIISASSEAAASSSSAAASSHNNSKLPSLPLPPIESLLSNYPRHFLCLGSFAIRQDGPVDVEKLALLNDSTHSLRMTFDQRLLPSGQPDTTDALRIVFRVRSLGGPTEEEKLRTAHERAKKRREQKRKKEKLEQKELDTGLSMDVIIAMARDASDSDDKDEEYIPSIEEEEKQSSAAPVPLLTQPPPLSDIVSVPIVWHSSAVIETHHRREIRIPQQAAPTAAAAAASSSLPSSASLITSFVLDSLFHLFSRGLIYLAPVYSPKQHLFLVYVYVMPHAWSGPHSAVNETLMAQARGRLENDVTSAHLTTLIEWACQDGGMSSINSTSSPAHFAPHSLFTASRPPALNSDETTSLSRLDSHLSAAGLKPQLRSYQKQALLWMLQRERQPWRALRSKMFNVALGMSEIESKSEEEKQQEANNEIQRMEIDGEEEESKNNTSQQELEDARNRLRSEYMATWRTLRLPELRHPYSSAQGAISSESSQLYFSPLLGHLSTLHPSQLETVEEVRGGILAEEMGLGKTLEVASMILVNTREVAQAKEKYSHGALVPILPRTFLPSSTNPSSSSSLPSSTHATSHDAMVDIDRPAPPLLVDPLELSKKEYKFYQHQVTTTATSSKCAAAASSSAANNNPDMSMDSDEGEAEFDLNAPNALPQVQRKPINCYCGYDALYFKDSSEPLVECEMCHKLQHALCMRVSSDDNHKRSSSTVSASYPYTYLCPSCSSLPATPKLPVSTTLIVCPDVILAQWQSELFRHVNEGRIDGPRLKILVYRGVRAVTTGNESESVDGETQRQTNKRRRSTATKPIAKSNKDTIDLIDSDTEDTIIEASSISSTPPTYSVFVATEDFVSIRVQRQQNSTAASSSAVISKSRAKPSAAAAAVSDRKKRARAAVEAEDDPATPASATPTALQFSLLRPAQFIGYDIVLTTYSTLRNDLYHTSTDVTASRSHRYAKKYRVLPSPLVGVEWWRLVLDEAQMLGEGTTRAADMAMMLTSVHRWNVTGTPIYKSLEDLYGLLLFLGALPYANRAVWRRVLAGPCEAGNDMSHTRMREMLSRLMWRNTKQSVAGQLGLPPTTYLITRITFTPIEKYYYEKRRDECRTASAYLREHGRAALTTVQLKKVFHSLLRMRQACVHPQIGSTGSLVSVSKQTLTLHDLSLQMLREARVQCEEIQRRMYFAMHGLAAIAIIKKEYAAAVELYERVVGEEEREMRHQEEMAKRRHERQLQKQEPLGEGDNKMIDAPTIDSSDEVVSRREIAIDDLQKIHALHNLADALAMLHGCRLSQVIEAGKKKEATTSMQDEEKKGNEELDPVKMEGSSPVKLEPASSSSELTPASSSSDPASPSTAAAASSSSSIVSLSPPLVLPPVAIMDRIQALHRFAHSIKAHYLSKQSLILADAQQSFFRSHAVVHEHASARGQGSWYLASLTRLTRIPELETRFIAALKRDLFASNESLVVGESTNTSIAKLFTNGAGLKLVLQRLIEELDAARGAATKRLSLQTRNQPPLESEIELSAHCSRCRINQTGAVCMNCKSSTQLGEYEKRLYRFRANTKNAYLAGASSASEKATKLNSKLILPGEGRSRKDHERIAEAQLAEVPDLAAAGLDEDDIRHMNNFMQQSELEATLKALLKFITEHRGEMSNSEHDPAIEALLNDAKSHLQGLELYKKELKAMLKLNRVHREQLSLYDELSMSTSRIRMRFDGETVLPTEKHFKLEAWEVDGSQMQFESDITEELATMREWRGRLRFLESQVVTEAGSQSADSSASSLCVICQEEDLTTVAEVAVLPCAHRFCVRCIMTMLDRREESQPWEPQQFGKVRFIKCPTCRNRTGRRTISYVKNDKKQGEKAKGQQLGGLGMDVASGIAASTPAATSASNATATASAPPPSSAAAAASASSSSAVTTMHLDSSHVNSNSATNNDPSTPLAMPAYPFKGSWSSKIHVILQCILHLLSTDPTNKILVFSEWLDVLTVIQNALRANSISFLQIGGSSASKKSMQESLALFKSNPMIPLLLLPLNTAASGLNIVEANHVILVEPNLSAGKEAQAIGRVVRIGQQRSTTVHRFIVQHSVEERIFAMHANQHQHEERQTTNASPSGDATEYLTGATRGEDKLDARDFMSLLDDGGDAGGEKKEMELEESKLDPVANQVPNRDDDEEAEQLEEEEMKEAMSRSASEYQLMHSPEPAIKSEPASSSSFTTAAAASSSSSSTFTDSASFLSAVDADRASLSSQHRYWTQEQVALVDEASGASRKVNRLQALVLLQRTQFFEKGKDEDTHETKMNEEETQESAGAATSSPSPSQLIEFHGKLITRQISTVLEGLVRA